MVQCTNLHENHGRNFLRRESPGFTQVLNLNKRISSLVNNIEWPRLDILLNNRVIEASPNQAPKILSESMLSMQAMGGILDVKDSVLRVHSSLIFGSFANQALFVCKRDKGGGGITTLFIGDYTMKV
jgi:NAD-dependent glutamate dehydrogenase